MPSKDTLTTAIVALYNVRSDLQESLLEAGYTGDMHTLDGIMRLDRAIADLEAERAGAQGAPLICVTCNDYLETGARCEVCYDNAVSAYEETQVELDALKAQTQGAVGMPDGPGDWWFNGTGAYAPDLPVYTIQERVKVVESNNALIAICEDVNGKGLMLRAVGDMHGQWWRVVKPWEPRPALDAMPRPLVTGPNGYGAFVIWPQGEIGKRGFEPHIEIIPESVAPDGALVSVPAVRWGVAGGEHDIEFTRMWAMGMLKACEIAATLRPRPATGEQRPLSESAKEE